jgi:hypothetical protein
MDDFSVKSSELCLVDLAGCESLKSTGFTEKRLMNESSKINQSMLALERVFKKLLEKQVNENKPLPKQSTVHIPYRDSKLTSLLTSSFLPNTRTHLVLTIKSSFSNEYQTR